jgi:hypothetical protein
MLTDNIFRIVDICQRVLGWQVSVSVEQANGVFYIEATGAKGQDPLTRSQQEMDIIMSLQHLLNGAAIKLIIG